MTCFTYPATPKDSGGNYDRRVPSEHTGNKTTLNQIRWETTLVNGEAEITPGIRAGVFGELVKLAAPVIEHYVSDLFHDTVWLSKYLNDAHAFFYSFNDYGTAIGDDEALIRAWRPENVYLVQLERRGRYNDKWVVVLTRISEFPEEVPA